MKSIYKMHVLSHFLIKSLIMITPTGITIKHFVFCIYMWIPIINSEATCAIYII